MNGLAVRTPEIIAAEIESIKGQTRSVILQSSIEIGKRLVEAKEMVSHGEWADWLKHSVDYSHSTANNLMKIYNEFGDSKIPTIENLSYTKAVALLGVPDEEREQFLSENDVEDMSAKELQQTIKEKKDLEKRLRKAEKEAEAGRKAQEELKQLKVELADAKIQDKKDDVNELQGRIKDLEKQLKEKPIDVPVIPEEVEKELAELREKVKRPSNTADVKFRIQFENLGSGFKDLLATLKEVKAADPETYEKYKTALKGLIEKMSERL